MTIRSIVLRKPNVLSMTVRCLLMRASPTSMRPSVFTTQNSSLYLVFRQLWSGRMRIR